MKWLTLFTIFLYSQISNSQGVSGESIKAQLVEEWEMAKNDQRIPEHDACR